MQLTLIFVSIATLKPIGIDARKNLKYFNQYGDPIINNHVIQRKEDTFFNLTNLIDHSQTNKLAQRKRIFKRNNEIYAKAPDKNIDKPIAFLSPRDKLVYEKKYKQDKYLVEESPAFNYASQNFTRMNYDFESLLERNLVNPKPSLPVNSRPRPVDTEKPAPKKAQFDNNSFFLKSMLPQEYNWTTCEEFAKGALFHPNDIIDIDWIPFYVWSTHGPCTSILHKFAYPTIKRVQQYKENYGKYVVVDWSQPKLLMTTNIEMLLLAGDRRGLFYGIPDAQMPLSIISSNATLPTVKIRMKILDPYLAMMYCEERYAVIMAIQGEDPSTDEEKEREASVLRFRGNGRTMSRNIEVEEQIKEAMAQRKTKEDQAKVIRVGLQRVNNPEALVTRF